MFSIENLAWRSSSLQFELPACEKGPNGGRVMWFPPYDLTYSETSSVDFGGTTFIGRPEPIYTYKSTSRTGQISFKIIVDYPSVLDVIAKKVLENESEKHIKDYGNLKDLNQLERNASIEQNTLLELEIKKKKHEENLKDSSYTLES
jgi:hypothetical protein